MEIIWKEVGETPLQALERHREEAGIARGVPMTYAGRLDPLAEGQLLILIGGECKEKEKYLGLDKEYEVDVLLGLSTDTGDPMGLITASGPGNSWSIEQIQAVLPQFVGKHTWAYPAFSSKTVQGKPLFLWSLEGRIGEIEIPTREVEIYEIELLGSRSTKLREEVLSKIASITPDNAESKRLGADFRREAVLKSWERMFQEFPRTSWQVVRVRVRCSSGTYMRTLAERLGEALSIPALALSIVRTKIMVY